MSTRLLYPSLMCMSPLEVRKDLRVLCRTFDGVHVDIMDGHFCRSIHLSPSFVEAIRTECELPIDVHLMVDAPGDYFDILAKSGANSVTIHIEAAVRNVHRLIYRMRELGLAVGIALCPATPVVAVEGLLSLVDMVTVLGVDPGFIGQSLVPSARLRIEHLAALREQVGGDYVIQIDGGVRSGNFESLAEAGAECFVLGKGALFDRAIDLEAAAELAQSEFRKSSVVITGEVGGID